MTHVFLNMEVEEGVGVSRDTQGITKSGRDLHMCLTRIIAQ